MKVSVPCLIFFLAVLTAGCNETTTTYYSGYQEAKNDALFQRGWMPDILPINTGPIIETHNLDNNKVCAQADIPVDSLQKTADKLKREGYGQFDSNLPDLPVFPFFSFENCAFDLEDLSKDRITISKNNRIVVLDMETNRFYYWIFK